MKNLLSIVICLYFLLPYDAKGKTHLEKIFHQNINIFFDIEKAVIEGMSEINIKTEKKNFFSILVI